MLNNNDELSVARYGAVGDDENRPYVNMFNPNDMTLQRVFGKDNRTGWNSWNGNGDNA